MIFRLNPKVWFGAHKMWGYLSLVAVLTLSIGLIIPAPVYASVQTILASIFLWIAQFFGGLVLTLIGILVEIAQYNDFINAPAVIKGWVIVRDVVNMFFIVVLLVISFGTIFRMEEYQYKHLLSKLLLMGVLVNFSKSIAGFFIDFAQVVMLTFVNGFKDAAAGNFVNGFHLDQMFQFAKETNPDQFKGGDNVLFYASLLALITVAITAVVVGVYLIVFILRIVALWFLIIISPIAFLTSAVPGKAHQYHDLWWDYFGRYASSGPILAFFLWLSLAVMQFSSSALGDFQMSKDSLGASYIPSVAVTGIGQSDILLSFVISIILLVGGLWMTHNLSVAGGKMAMSAVNNIKNVGKYATTAPLKLMTKTASWAGRKMYRYTGAPIFYLPALKEARHEHIEEKKRRDIAMGMGRSGDLLKKRFGFVAAAGSADWRAAFGAGGPLNWTGLKHFAYAAVGGKKGWTKVNDEMEAEQKKAYIASRASKFGNLKEIYTDKYNKKLTESTDNKKVADEDLEKKKKSLYDYRDLLTKKAEGKLNDKQEERLKVYEHELGPEDQVTEDRVLRIQEGSDEKENEYLKTHDEYRSQMKEYEKYKDLPGEENRQKAKDHLERALLAKDKMGQMEANKEVLVAPLLAKQKELGEDVALARQKLQVTPEQMEDEARKELEDEATKKETEAKKLKENKFGADARKTRMDGLERLLEELVKLQRRAESEKAKKVTDPANYMPALVAGLEEEMKNKEAEVSKLEDQIKGIDDGTAYADKDAEATNTRIAKDYEVGSGAIKKYFEEIDKARTENPGLTQSQAWSEATRKKLTDEANKYGEAAKDLAKERAHYNAPPTYAADQARRAMTTEEMRKIQTANYHELIDYFRQAQTDKDPVKMEAILRKLAQDYNDNEIVNAYGYTSDFDGFRKFFETEVQKNGGMSEQQTLALANDISYINEDRHHWDTARIIGTEQGKFKWFSQDEHVMECLAEIRKLNPREVARGFNRLSYGGEQPNADGTRNFKISPLGIALVSNLGAEIAQFIQRAETNPNIVVNLWQERDIISKIPNIHKLKHMNKDLLEYMKEKMDALPDQGNLDASINSAMKAAFRL